MRRAFPLILILLLPAAAAAECLGPVSPDGKSIACAGANASFSVRGINSEITWEEEVPPFVPSPGTEPFKVRISSIHWSPDSSKLLISAPYHDIHEIYTVYDVRRRLMLRQTAANNFLSWLPDSLSYLSHNSYEGFCGEIEVDDRGRYLPSLTFYRNALDGKPRLGGERRGRARDGRGSERRRAGP